MFSILPWEWNFIHMQRHLVCRCLFLMAQLEGCWWLFKLNQPSSPLWVEVLTSSWLVLKVLAKDLQAMSYLRLRDLLEVETGRFQVYLGFTGALLPRSRQQREEGASKGSQVGSSPKILCCLFHRNREEGKGVREAGDPVSLNFFLKKTGELQG